jgi:Zn finger protein HypA/HybF involved in hydrogenase expression
MKTIFNVYSGSVFELHERKPKASCKKCYGRGYIGKDKLKFIFQPCTQCIEKNILPGYEKQIVFNYIKFTAAPNVL